MAKGKSEVISFKVDDSLAKTLSGIENRSDFIRNAILTALENVCPLCKGTGLITPNQKIHWERFSINHRVETCKVCKESHLVCDDNIEGKGHHGK